MVCFGAACEGNPSVKPPVQAEVHSAPVARTSPTLELLAKEISTRFPGLAVDVAGTGDGAELFAAMRKQAVVDVPIVALEALGLGIDAASRRTGRARGACWTGDARARTSNAGLGETLDERWHTTVHLVLVPRDELIDVPPVDRRATTEAQVRVEGFETTEAAPTDRMETPAHPGLIPLG